MKLRFSLRTLFLLMALCAIGLAIPYWIPKSQVLTIHDSHIGYYRGLGLVDGVGYFGKNWYRIVVREDPEGYWEVDVNGFGYSPYRGYYPTGRLREEGMCMVEPNGDDIYPNRHDLRNGRFYDPIGHLISEVKNRTGKQILCNSDGTRSWELDLLDGEYAHVKMWHPNGQLAHESRYQNGVQHGVSVGYYSNGQLRYRGEYSNGNRVGVWKEYSKDGALESETNEGPSRQDTQ